MGVTRFSEAGYIASFMNAKALYDNSITRQFNLFIIVNTCNILYIRY